MGDEIAGGERSQSGQQRSGEGYVSALSVVLVADVAVVLGVIALILALPARRTGTEDNAGLGRVTPEAETESRVSAA